MSRLVDGYRLTLRKNPSLEGWVAQWSETAGFEIFFSQETNLPAISANPECSVILDGFLHNRSEFVERTEPSTATDADLIARAYARFGSNLFSKLRGVFSLAIWDLKQNQLLYGRDHSGIYPSFYAIKGAEIIFSTSVADVIKHPIISSTLNRSAFVDFLCHRRPMPEETYYAEIKRVLPGHSIQFTKTSLKVHRYWYPIPPEGIPNYITDLDSTGFDRMLERAVRRCLISEQSGILLSGGLDSVSIACVATDLARMEGLPLPTAYSIGFPHPDFNEVDKQTGVAQQLGLQLCLKQVDEIVAGRGLVTSALELGQTRSQPLLSTWQPLFLELASQARKMGCKVILTGTGGDEWLNVGSILMADLIRLMDFRGIERAMKVFMRSYRVPRGALMRYLFWKAGIRTILGEYSRRAGATIAPGMLRNRIRKRFRSNTLHWVAADPQLRAEADERLEVLVEQYMNKVLPGGKYAFYCAAAIDHFVNTITSMELEESYESSRQIRIPLLHPYLDPDLINLAVRISPEVLQQGGMEKGIIRDSVTRRFPNMEFQTQKKASAVNYWLSLITTEGKEIYHDIGGPKSLIELGIIDGNAMGPLMEQAFTSNRLYDNAKIWDILSLETWCRSHRI
jgi:asparagine synthetase B (glutamine-hydrolysing)